MITLWFVYKGSYKSFYFLNCHFPPGVRRRVLAAYKWRQSTAMGSENMEVQNLAQGYPASALKVSWHPLPPSPTASSIMPPFQNITQKHSWIKWLQSLHTNNLNHKEEPKNGSKKQIEMMDGLLLVHSLGQHTRTNRPLALGAGNHFESWWFG